MLHSPYIVRDYIKMVVPRKLSPNLISINKELEKQTLTLLENGSTSLSVQKLYKYVEFLCRDRYQSKLTTFLYRAIDVYSESHYNKFKTALDVAKSPEESLSFFNGFVDALQLKCPSLTKIYLYLDRTYLLSHPLKLTIQEYVHELIVGYVFRNTEIAQVVLSALANVLDSYRSCFDESLKKLIVSTYERLLPLNSYPSINTYIQKSTESFFIYLNKDLQNRSKDDEPATINVFRAIYENILKEIELWSIIDKDSISIYKKIVIEDLLLNEFETSGDFIMKPALINKKFNDVSILFRFIKNDTENTKSRNLNTFLKIWHEYVSEYLFSIIEDNIQDNELIFKLIKSKKDLNIVVKNFFDSDPDVDFKLRDSFQAVISSAQNNVSAQVNKKLLSYTDSFFRSATNITTEQDEQTLNDLFTIWKSIKSKEAFLKEYQRDLSKRLILSATANIQLELYFIKLLETEINPDLLKPLHTMFKDIENSKTLKQQYENSKHPSMDFTPLVLNSHSWPVSKTKITLTDELSHVLSDFQYFYLSSNTKQTLQWCYGQSFMTVTWNLNDGGVYNLEVSTFQGVVLLLFSEFGKLSYNDIKQKTKLDSKTLSSILHSLSKGKYKVLLKDEEGYYHVNESFQARKQTLKIKHVKMKLIKKVNDLGEVEEYHESGGSEDEGKNQDHKFSQEESLQAFIVRLLKFKILIKHDDLVNQCLDKFIIERSDIKKSIQVLITNEYISREGKDGYRYIPA